MTFLNIIQLNNFLQSSEDSTMESFKIRNGFSKAAGITATATKGAKVHLSGEVQYKCVSSKKINEWIDKNTYILNQEEKEKLDKDRKAGVIAGGLLTGFFGVFFGGYGDVKHETKEKTIHKEESNEHYQAVKQFKELEEQIISVKVEMEVIGLSNIPTTASAFIEVTQFSFEDGTKLTVISSDTPVAASDKGDTSKVETGQAKLDIIEE